jgi:hypothetical protein
VRVLVNSIPQVTRELRGVTVMVWSYGVTVTVHLTSHRSRDDAQLTAFLPGRLWPSQI